jgi:hypothetical protein
MLMAVIITPLIIDIFAIDAAIDYWFSLSFHISYWLPIAIAFIFVISFRHWSFHLAAFISHIYI